jgi:hypothetical protein
MTDAAPGAAGHPGVAGTRHNCEVDLMEQRPAPADVWDAQTLRRWYWLRSELVEIARGLGLSTSGGKLEVAERLCAHFEQRLPAPSPVRPKSRDMLPTDLTPEVMVHEGQRCTQQLRIWMREQVGPAFSFDAPMREAVHAGGITLGDLVDVWRVTRGRGPTQISPQFELNRFSRAWHTDHPNDTHAQMLAAWAEHRNRPRESGA